ncbi:hypothetical protein AAEU23_005085 [Escherichia coli]
MERHSQQPQKSPQKWPEHNSGREALEHVVDVHKINKKYQKWYKSAVLHHSALFWCAQKVSNQSITADGESSSLSSSGGTARAPSSTLRAVRAAFRRPPLPLLHPACWRRLNDLPTQKSLHKKSTFHAKHEALFLICVLSWKAAFCAASRESKRSEFKMFSVELLLYRQGREPTEPTERVVRKM